MPRLDLPLLVSIRLRLSAAMLLTASLVAAAPQPNIVFVYTDDQAAWTIGGRGNSQARTPNLDRLFREGVRLVNAFVTTPVCSPSRAGLMASRYGTELGITDYLNPSREPDNGLDPGLVIWPEVLQRAGYTTAFIGKWHLGRLDRYHPLRNGYDHFTGFRVGASTSKDPEVEFGTEVRTVNGYTPDILTDAAMAFVREHAADEQPFLVNLHFWAPHANTKNRTPDGDRTWLPLSTADWKPFRNLDPRLPQPDYPDLDIPRAKRMMREYLASIASVDRNVGRLLDLLDELRLARNTVVIFTSDHGYNLGHNGIWHKGNGRWLLTDNQGPRANMYDHSLRVPAVVRWPQELTAGTVVNETVTNLDWYPTILDLAGLAMADDALVRGRSFRLLLQGEQIPWENDFYAEYQQKHSEVTDQRCWRTSEWKLIRDFARSDKDELYHLTDDPDERRNLVASTDPGVQRVRKQLDQRLAEAMAAIHVQDRNGATANQLRNGEKFED